MKSRAMDHRRPPRGFDVDGMLGSLTKWLRILGLDAAFPRTTPSSGRSFVTMKRMPVSLDVVGITKVGTAEQLEQFLELTGLRPDPNMLLTRCLICNVRVRKVSRQQVCGKVPEQVFDIFSDFTECPSCGRVFWEGSHGKRIAKALERIGNLRWRSDGVKSEDV
jgi:uncharacterized protein with PIN domain